MGRGIRMVPPTWTHPENREGSYIPLFDGKEFEEECKVFDENEAKWQAGTHKALLNGFTTELAHPSYGDWDNPRPKPEDYMLVGVPMEERTHMQLYETTTEGTPIGPVFEDLDSLCEWAETHATTFADFKTTKEEWKRMLEGDCVHHQEGNMVFL